MKKTKEQGTLRDEAFGIIPFYKNSRGEFLFCLVRHAEGHWGFPKGHREGRETEEETAVRELREETGIVSFRLFPGVAFTERYQAKKDGRTHEKTVSYFLALVRSMSATTPADFQGEILETAWAPYEEARGLITHESGKTLMDEAYQYAERSVGSL